MCELGGGCQVGRTYDVCAARAVGERTGHLELVLADEAGEERLVRVARGRLE